MKQSFKYRIGRVGIAVVLAFAAPILIQPILAERPPQSPVRSFAFPLSSANAVSGNLVMPAGSSSHLHFDDGLVAVGELPVPLRAARVGRRQTERFFRPPTATVHARLLLRGVAGADGNLVSNSGNEFVIDALVTPTTAASSAPPFVVPFEIDNGTAFVDATLPVDAQADGSVRVQILGISLIDAEGQTFGVLGFQLGRLPPTPAQPTARPTVAPEGRCYAAPNCSGPSFALSQDRCCRLGQPSAAGTLPLQTSWCPADQLDASTGACNANACIGCEGDTAQACGARPACAGTCTVVCADGHVESGTCENATTCECSARCDTAAPPPTPQACSDRAQCGGSCSVVCGNGTVVAGQCLVNHIGKCDCSANCSAPTPCGSGQCFDTVAFRCTGEPCGAGLRCPLPNQFCDVTGTRCPCSPAPPPPQGQICCQCKDPTPGCFDLSFAEAQAICPRGCTTIVGGTCDQRSGGCLETACAGDGDCDDGNGCTIDHCRNGNCEHDCVCVGPFGCGPGPAAGPRHQ